MGYIAEPRSWEHIYKETWAVKGIHKAISSYAKVVPIQKGGKYKGKVGES